MLDKICQCAFSNIKTPWTDKLAEETIAAKSSQKRRQMVLFQASKVKSKNVFASSQCYK